VNGRRCPPFELSVGRPCSGGPPLLDYIRLLEPAAERGELGGTVKLDQGPVIRLEGVEVILIHGKRPFGFTSVNHRGFYPLKKAGYEVEKGRRRVYYPIYIERCPRGNCDPGLAPKKAGGL